MQRLKLGGAKYTTCAFAQPNDFRRKKIPAAIRGFRLNFRFYKQRGKSFAADFICSYCGNDFKRRYAALNE